MKKTILLLFVFLTAILAKAQEGEKDMNRVCVYGVDYSLVKVFGSDEDPAAIIDAFNRINRLLIVEGKKYDVGKYLKKKVDKIDLATVEAHNDAVSPTDLMTGTSDYELPFAAIEDLVKKFDTGNYHGYGFLLVAHLLNKSSRKASYTAVIFDTDTKEIVKSSFFYGNGKGFGLRNYWANSVHDVIKDLKHY